MTSPRRFSLDRRLVRASAVCAILAACGCTPEGAIPKIDESELLDDAMEAEALYSARRHLQQAPQAQADASEAPEEPQAPQGDLAGLPPEDLRSSDGTPVDADHFLRQRQKAKWVLRDGKIESRDAEADEAPLGEEVAPRPAPRPLPAPPREP